MRESFNKDVERFIIKDIHHRYKTIRIIIISLINS